MHEVHKCMMQHHMQQWLLACKASFKGQPSTVSLAANLEHISELQNRL
jgi:hypothetical protein